MNPFELNRIVTGHHRFKSPTDAKVSNSRNDINRTFAATPDYKGDATCNGVSQEFLVVKTDFEYKKTLIARPGEVFYMGDIIDVFDCKWIVTDIDPDDTFYLKGEITLCNLDLHWMDQWGNTHTQWCYLKEPYSDLNKTAQIISTPQKQFSLYIPCNKDTKHFYIDQRLVLDVGTDKNGNDLPYVFRITSVDTISQYRKYGTLMKLNIREVAYDQSDDDPTTMLANVLQSKYEIEVAPIGAMSPGDALHLSFVLRKDGVITDVLPQFNVVDESIAVVDTIGCIHAKRVGSTEIQVSYGTTTVSVPLNVEVEADYFVSCVIRGDARIYLGQSKQYVGVVMCNSDIVEQAVSWELCHDTTTDEMIQMVCEGNICTLTVGTDTSYRNKQCTLRCTADGADVASRVITLQAPI
jgi:hypothetical protein